MQLTMIVTHRVPATLSRGTCITATGWTTNGERHTQQVSWNHSLSATHNHLFAAAHICEAIEPAQRAWVMAETHDGYTFLPVRDDTQVTL